MQIVWKHIIRNVMANKLRSFIIVLSLSLSTIILYSTLTIGDNVVEKYTESLLEVYQEYDIQIAHEDSTRFNLDDLNIGDEFKGSTLPVTTALGNYNYVTDKYDKNIDVVFIGTDREKLISDGLITLSSSREDWDDNEKKQIIISKNTSEKYGIELSDTILVTTSNGDIKYTVKAIAENAGYASQEVSSSLYVYVTQSEAEENSISGVDFILMNLSEGINIDSYIEEFNINNDGYEASALVNYDEINQSINSTKQVLTIILVCVIGINFFVISSFTKLLLATRTPVLGTFRSVGASKFIVNMVLILENIVYGLIGGALGIILTLLLNAKIVEEFIGYEGVANAVNIGYIVLALLFSVVLQLCIVITSIIKTNKIDIISSVFNKVDVSATSSWKQFSMGIILFATSIILYFSNNNYNYILAVLALLCAIIGGALMVTKIAKVLVDVITGKMNNGPIRMGIKNVSHSKITQTNVNLVSSMLAILLLIYILSMSISSFFSGAIETIDADYLISGMKENVEKYDFLDENTDIKNYRIAYYEMGKVEINSKEYYNFGITGMNEATNGIKDPSDHFSKLDNNEILVDEIFAKKNDLLVGDVVLLASEMLTEEVEFTILGYIDAGSFYSSRECFVINEETYFKYVSKAPKMIYVNTTTVSEEVYFKLYDDTYQYDLTLVTDDEYLAVPKNSIDGAIQLIYIMFILSFVLAFVGIINNLLIGFLQHQKEYAILLSTAMSKLQVKKMIFTEIVFSFLISCILGGALSLWLSKIVELILYSINFGIIGDINIMSILFVLLAVLVVLSMTFFVPNHKLKKMDIVNQIKGEE